MKIGILLPTWCDSAYAAPTRGNTVLDRARLAEDMGLSSVWVIDHFCYQPYLDYQAMDMEPPAALKGVTRGAWESLTLCAGLAATTEKLEIGTLVANTGYRNPALLARMADTIDELSNGRLVLGLGAGDMPSEHRAFGFSYERRVSRFEEALQIIRPMLKGDAVTFSGEFYQTEEAQLIPKGIRPQGPPIMIGLLGGGPRMRRLVAQYADHWNGWLAYGDSRPDNYGDIAGALDDSCHKYSRDPATLVRHVTLSVCLQGEDFPLANAIPLRCSASELAGHFNTYSDLGVEHISVFPYPNDISTMELIAAAAEKLS